MAKIEASGGKILMTRTAIPGVGWLAYGQDTEGNNFGVLQTDENPR